MRLHDSVTNAVTGERFIVSTIEVGTSGFIQTSVFRQRLGPLAGFLRPVFVAGPSEYNLSQHFAAVEMARSIDPRDWPK